MLIRRKNIRNNRKFKIVVSTHFYVKYIIYHIPCNPGLKFIFSIIRETKVKDLIEEEISSCPTLSFRAVPCHIENKMYEMMKQVEELEANVESMRNKLIIIC
jgi:hypothetical protein